MSAMCRVGCAGWLALALCAASAAQPAKPTKLRTPETSHYDVPIGVQRLFLQAQLQYWAGQYAPALKKITSALAEAPDYVEGHHLYQDIRTALDETEGVIARYRSRLKRKPDDPVSHYLLGRVVPDLKEKEALFRRAAKLDPKLPWPHYGLGHLYERQRKWLDSEKAFKAAVSLKPTEAPFQHGLGFCYLQQGRNEDAEKAFKAALACDADHVDSLVNLSVIALRRKAYPEAEAYCHQALKVDKDNPWAQNNLGKACFWQGKNTAALRAYKAAASSPRYDTPEVAYLNMGFVYRRQNKPAQAAAAFRRAIELRADFAYAHVMLAYVLYDQQKYAEAWAEVKKAEKLGYTVHAEFLKALSQAAPRPEQ